MRTARVPRKRSSLSAASFYCRHRNRMVATCGMTGGPESCPVRSECLAHAGAEGNPASPQTPAS
jgi:hypothetical protein